MRQTIVIISDGEDGEQEEAIERTSPKLLETPNQGESKQDVRAAIATYFSPGRGLFLADSAPTSSRKRSKGPSSRRPQTIESQTASLSPSKTKPGTDTSKPPGELDVSKSEVYNRIVAGIDIVLQRYAERGEEPSENADRDPVQWPIRLKKNGRKIVRYCLCQSRSINRKNESVCVRCYDPACDMPGGFYHLKCLSEDQNLDRLSTSQSSTSPHTRGSLLC